MLASPDCLSFPGPEAHPNSARFYRRVDPAHHNLSGPSCICCDDRLVDALLLPQTLRPAFRTGLRSPRKAVEGIRPNSRIGQEEVDGTDAPSMARYAVVQAHHSHAPAFCSSFIELMPEVTNCASWCRGLLAKERRLGRPARNLSIPTADLREVRP